MHTYIHTHTRDDESTQQNAPEGVEVIKLDHFHEVEGVLELFLRLPREADDDVSGDGRVGCHLPIQKNAKKKTKNSSSSGCKKNREHFDQKHTMKKKIQKKGPFFFFPGHFVSGHSVHREEPKKQ